MLHETLRQNTTAHWKALSDVHDVPVSAIQNSEQVLNDPQVAAINQFESIVLPGHPEKSVKVPRIPVHLSSSPAIDLGRPPSLGENSRAILMEAGYTESELNELVEKGACKFA